MGTWIILKICDALIGVRVGHEAEREGLDLSQHGESAYSAEGLVNGDQLSGLALAQDLYRTRALDQFYPRN